MTRHSHTLIVECDHKHHVRSGDRRARFDARSEVQCIISAQGSGWRFVKLPQGEMTYCSFCSTQFVIPAPMGDLPQGGSFNPGR